MQFIDLKTQSNRIEDRLLARFKAVLNHGAFIMGPEIIELEQVLAKFVGVEHALGVASGTDALLIALMALGIGAGDEVITTPFSFFATAEVVALLGAKPVFVDIDKDTYNIDASRIEAAITAKTKAIMPVHLFGQPAELEEIVEICERNNLTLIEDCCQSFGASIDSKQTGAFGHAAGYSFFPSKNLGAFGDGGLVVTNSDETAAKIKQLRNHGSDVRYYHDVIGYNSRLDEMQAVILRAKLKRIDQYNQARRHVAHLYSELMADLPLITPYEDNVGEHVYHQYTLLSDRRDEILAALQAHQIGAAVYYPVPLHKQNVFKEECAGVSLPVTESVSEHCFSLPICPFLEDDTIREIVSVIRGVLTA